MAKKRKYRGTKRPPKECVMQPNISMKQCIITYDETTISEWDNFVPSYNHARRPQKCINQYPAIIFIMRREGRSEGGTSEPQTTNGNPKTHQEKSCTYSRYKNRTGAMVLDIILKVRTANRGMGKMTIARLSCNHEWVDRFELWAGWFEK